MIHKIRKSLSNWESGGFFRFLFALFLITAAALMWLERDGGQLLVHTVPLEISEYRYVNARISRPLSAQSLDQRPAIAVISERSISRFDTLEDAVIGNSLGLPTLTIDGYTQGDQQDWIAANIGETTAPELISAAVDFLRSQPFVSDDGVAVLFRGFTRGDLLDFLPALSRTAAILWQPYANPTAAEIAELNDQFGDTLTVLSPSVSASEKTDLLSGKLSRTSRPLLPQSNAVISFLAVLMHAVTFAAFLTLIPINRAESLTDTNIVQKGGKPIETAAALMVPLLYGAAYFFLPNLLNRPRFVSDSLIFIMAVASVLLYAASYLKSRGADRYGHRSAAPVIRCVPAVIWMTAVPTALFILTGSAFRVSGIGLTIIDLRQIYSVLVYLPVLFLFGRALQDLKLDSKPERIFFGCASATFLILVLLCLTRAGLPVINSFGVCAAMTIWVSMLRFRRFRCGGCQTCLLLSLYAAIMLSSGIMIGS